LQTSATGAIHGGDVTDYAQGATVGKVAMSIIFNKGGMLPLAIKDLAPPSRHRKRAAVLQERDDSSSNRHRALFLSEHDLFRKTGVHFSGSCSRLEE
jgi:hypothetical protein